MKALLLRLEAPMLAFGGTMVDQLGVVRRFPATSMLTGLIANALGWDHADWEKLNRLQERIRFAARLEHPGQELEDFHTVDLGQDWLIQTGWTTRGVREDRAGGTASSGTHIRYRRYWADGGCLVVLTLDPAEEAPDLVAVEQALHYPARPLFVGRKCCLPTAMIAAGWVEAADLWIALGLARSEGVGRPTSSLSPLLALWPAEAGAGSESRPQSITDERDWRNQIHGGERLVREGQITLQEASK